MNSSKRIPDKMKAYLRAKRIYRDDEEMKEQSKVEKTQNSLSELKPVKKRQILCTICQQSTAMNKLTMAFSCNHTYCNDCLIGYVRYKISIFEEVICPDQECFEKLDRDSSIYRNRVGVKEQEVYEKICKFYAVNSDQSKKLCPNEKCDGVLKIDPKSRAQKCSQCGKAYCSECFLESHPGNCEDYEVRFLEDSLKFKRCFKCKMVVERISGCNHMTCRCGYQFCYICGGEWSHDHICSKNSNSSSNQPYFQRRQQLQTDHGLMNELPNYYRNTTNPSIPPPQMQRNQPQAAQESGCCPTPPTSRLNRPNHDHLNGRDGRAAEPIGQCDCTCHEYQEENLCGYEQGCLGYLQCVLKCPYKSVAMFGAAFLFILAGIILMPAPALIAAIFLIFLICSFFYGPIAYIRSENRSLWQICILIILYPLLLLLCFHKGLKMGYFVFERLCPIIGPIFRPIMNGLCDFQERNSRRH